MKLTESKLVPEPLERVSVKSSPWNPISVVESFVNVSVILHPVPVKFPEVGVTSPPPTLPESL